MPPDLKSFDKPLKAMKRDDSAAHGGDSKLPEPGPPQQIDSDQIRTVRVLIADDHAMVRQGLSSLLQGSAGFEVVAEVENGAQAEEVVAELKPDVALVDVRMTVLNGVDATARIIAVSPTTHVLGISAHDEASSIEGMLKAGARGYILKDASVDEMLDAIRRVARGEYYLGVRIIRQVVDQFILGDSQGQASRLSVLTPREREVAQLLSEGYSTRHIANRLFVSIKTIDTHRYQILKKLDLRGIADLTRLALREGLSSLDS